MIRAVERETSTGQYLKESNTEPNYTVTHTLLASPIAKYLQIE